MESLPQLQEAEASEQKHKGEKPEEGLTFDRGNQRDNQKTPMVNIDREPQEVQKNHYADLDYLSDNGCHDGPSVKQQAAE